MPLITELNNEMRIREITQSLINKMHIVSQEFNVEPRKDHTGCCIAHVDGLEYRDDFLEELVDIITDYVYSVTTQKQILDSLSVRTEAKAYSKLYRRAASKFRDQKEGQLGELLLFILIQYLFNAEPLLRKMKITSNPQMERNGLDAIHIRKDLNDGYTLFLGEAKTSSQSEVKKSFSSAFRAAVKDIETHYLEHRSEFNLYTYEDFLEPELENIAQAYMEGELRNIKTELVCIILFEADIETKDEISNEVMIEAIEKGIERLRDKNITSIKKSTLKRVNYIFFPAIDFKSLVREFDEKVGIR